MSRGESPSQRRPMTAVVRANAPEKSPARDELAKSDASERVVTYLPDNSLRRGYFSVFGDIARELSRTHWLTYQLFKRDVVSFYKQSLLGAFWIVFVPLVTLGTFVLLKGCGVVAVSKLDAPCSAWRCGSFFHRVSWPARIRSCWAGT